MTFTRYVGEICFKLDTLKIVRSEKIITLSDSTGKMSAIQFDDDILASLWEKYFTFWSENQDSDQDEESRALAPTKSIV